MKEREEEIFDLKSQLNDAKNIKINNQQLHDALIHDFKKTISVCFTCILLTFFFNMLHVLEFLIKFVAANSLLGAHSRKKFYFKFYHTLCFY